MAEQIAKAERGKAKIDGLKNTLREKYGDVVNDLSIGNVAPEIKIQASGRLRTRRTIMKVFALGLFAKPLTDEQRKRILPKGPRHSEALSRRQDRPILVPQG